MVGEPRRLSRLADTRPTKRSSQASVILNGSEDVQYEARKAFGFGPTFASMSSMVLDEDVEPLVKEVKEKLGRCGRNRAALSMHKETNLGRGRRRP